MKDHGERNQRLRAPEELDEIAKIRRDSTRILAIMSIVTSLVIITVLAIGGIAIAHVLQQLSDSNSSSCSFFGDVAILPVEASGPKKTSYIGVKLIIDARNAYDRRTCPRPLPPISLALSELANEYRIQLSDSGPVTSEQVAAYIRTKVTN